MTDPDLHDRIRIMVRAGLSVRQIAARIGMLPTDAEVLLASLGLKAQRSAEPHKRIKRTWNVYWTDKRMQELEAHLETPEITYAEIAQRMGKSVFAIVSQMKKMGLSAAKSPQWVGRRSYDKMPAIRYEDDPRGDSDKRRGRVPQPTARYSLTGNSSYMCTR